MANFYALTGNFINVDQICRVEIGAGKDGNQSIETAKIHFSGGSVLEFAGKPATTLLKWLLENHKTFDRN